jgi:hypothetical protein
VNPLLIPTLSFVSDGKAKGKRQKEKGKSAPTRPLIIGTTGARHQSRSTHNVERRLPFAFCLLPFALSSLTAAALALERISNG